MSHVTKMTFQVLNPTALKKAALSIGMEVRNQTTYRTYGGAINKGCEFALGVPGSTTAYEIGVVKEGDEYALKTDFYAGGKGLAAVTGQQGCKLKQAYSKIVTLKKLQKLKMKGYKFVERVNEKGELVLRGTK